MFRQWMCISMLLLIGVPLWAQQTNRGFHVVPTEQRVALVVGNATYKKGPLRNPVNDADSMEAALKACGFNVLKHTDLNRKEMFKTVRAFGDSIKHGGVGLFYYSGHGIQVDSQNYLVPVDADIKTEEEVASQCLDMQLVLDKMNSASNQVNILILDACRNTPVSGVKSWGSSRGLANIGEVPGVLIAYATAPGKVAEDGDGPNSPYTAALVKEMHKPGLSISQFFINVRNRVMEATKGQQTPQEVSILTSPFSFIPRPEAPGSPALPLQPSAVPEPLCTGQPEGSACWMELTNQPKCYVWNPSYSPVETVTWDRQCSGGFAQGKGTLIWVAKSDTTHNAQGTLHDGKQTGDWVFRYSNGSIRKGPFVNGQPTGYWVISYSNATGMKGTLVDGNMHGPWVIQEDNGTVKEGAFKDNKMHGSWVFRHSNGTTQKGIFKDGKQIGHWVWSIPRPNGGIAEGPHKDGKMHGHWIIQKGDGTVMKGSFEDSKQTGDWIISYSNGTVMEGPYEDGKKHGHWVKRDANGRVEDIIYENGEEVNRSPRSKEK